MSDHSSALVPLESWCYNSPELLEQGRHADIGLFTEALIYYDKIFLNITTQNEFAELLQWFISQGKFHDLIALFKDGTITVYEYSFASAVVEKDGAFLVMNIQDEEQLKPKSFERRFLYHPLIEKCLPHARQRELLYNALRNNVIEVKAEEFGATIRNATEDYINPERSNIIIQCLIDELYKLKKLGKPPKIVTSVRQIAEGKHQVQWNIDMRELARNFRPFLNLHEGTPLAGAIHSNRAIWSSSVLSCDLYLGQPMSSLVGDKLYETAIKEIKLKNIIEQLECEVEYPDIRRLVNNGILKFDDITFIRKHSKKFRTWLKDESDRDRNALIAYHNEISKDIGLKKYGKKILNILGFIQPGLSTGAGYLIGSSNNPDLGIAAGIAAGIGSNFIIQTGKKLCEGWKPIVFGNWLKNRIERLFDNE